MFDQNHYTFLCTMFYHIGDILQAIVLFLNSLTILNERRVLRPLGLNQQTSYLEPQQGPKQKLFNLIVSLQAVMKCLSFFFNSC